MKLPVEWLEHAKKLELSYGDVVVVSVPHFDDPAVYANAQRNDIMAAVSRAFRPARAVVIDDRMKVGVVRAANAEGL